MSAPPPAKKNEIGVTIRGTPEKGHQIVIEDRTAVKDLFQSETQDMADGLLSHCLKVLTATEASDDYPSHDERAFMLATIKELAPRDALERMLAVQMAATHVAMVRSGRWLASTQTVEQVTAHYTGYNKLARSFTAQMEALRKHRNGGKQTVVVQRVDVGEGGQAIVGNVQTGEGNSEK